MLPQTTFDLTKTYRFIELPTATYKLNIDKNLIAGRAEELEAMRQAVYLMLNTERYRYVIYSDNYGVELDDLIGKPMDYVMSEAKRRISDALLQDSRITGVEDFDFIPAKKAMLLTFTVKTVYGNLSTEKEVGI